MGTGQRVEATVTFVWQKPWRSMEEKKGQLFWWIYCSSEPKWDKNDPADPLPHSADGGLIHRLCRHLPLRGGTFRRGDL